MGAGLDDDEGSVGGAPIVDEYDIGGIGEETGLAEVLQKQGYFRVQSFDDQYLQEVGGERPR